MKLNTTYVALAVAIFSVLAKVQGKANLNGPNILRSHNFYRSAHDHKKVVGSYKPATMENSIIGQTIFNNEIKTQRILKYLDEELPAPIIADSLEKVNTDAWPSTENSVLTNTRENERINNMDLDSIVKTNSFQGVVKDDRVNKQPKSQAKIITSTQGIAKGQSSVTRPSTLRLSQSKLWLPSIPILPQIRKEKGFEHFVATTTPSGINCQRVMNSELNDRGEIIDSVMLVCDPPTTTTTTTKKPTVKTTTKATTTTPKPAIKICRPVMNSYLNDKGEIVDSVTIVCKIQPVS